MYGLEAGRAHAARARRGRRVWNQAVTLALALTIAAGVVAGAWFGYQVYLEHSQNAEIEHQQGVEEQARRNAQQSVDDVIDELGHTPAWNGPGTPAFRVAPDTTEP